jgi:hypothetical protein
VLCNAMLCHAMPCHAVLCCAMQVWGLDFGDCHKSLFAHQDTVRAVGFVRDTHYAFRWGPLLEFRVQSAPALAFICKDVQDPLFW